jgi:hypothetical protein
MAKNKTTETQNSVADFLKSITDEKKRNDCSAIIELISKHTGIEPKMWGTSIVGFGIYHYKYDSGHKVKHHWLELLPGQMPLHYILDRTSTTRMNCY